MSRPSDYSITSASNSPSQTPFCKKDFKFWLVIVSTCICPFLTALEFSSVSTALPAIASALHADSFTWVGSVYALSAAASLPTSSGLSQAFSRRPTLLLTITIFALGSGVCGAAISMNMLIAGRVIQGLGGGGIQSLTAIILADLVSFQERGAFVGVLALVWCFSASFGPLVGGALAAAGQWRWLFYLNIPISAASSLLVLLFLDLPIPPGNVREKLGRIDWIGTFLFVSSAVSCMIGLTWGGITAPWTSAKVLVPLVLGATGLVTFLVYEAKYAKFSIVPFVLLKNRMSLSGYAQAFISQVTLIVVEYFLPVYFQACKGASPVQSGVYMLAFTPVGISAFLVGLLVRITLKYQLVMWIGWVASAITFVFMGTIRATTSMEEVIGLTVLIGVASGCLQSTPMYPIQAPLPVTENAAALSFMCFVHWFGTVWSVTIGSQNEFSKNVPASFLKSIPRGVEIFYALIPSIHLFPPEIRIEVQATLANSLRVLWRAMAYVCAAGFVSLFFMKEIQLTDQLDAEWILQREGDMETEDVKV